jgi:hypothetical protein
MIDQIVYWEEEEGNCGIYPKTNYVIIQWVQVDGEERRRGRV